MDLVVLKLVVDSTSFYFRMYILFSTRDQFLFATLKEMNLKPNSTYSIDIMSIYTGL